MNNWFELIRKDIKGALKQKRQKKQKNNSINNIVTDICIYVKKLKSNKAYLGFNFSKLSV